HLDYRPAIRALWSERDPTARFEAALQWAYAKLRVDPQRPYASVTALQTAVLLAHLIDEFAATELSTTLGGDAFEVLGAWLHDTSVFMSKLKSIPEDRRQHGFDGIIAAGYGDVGALWRGVCIALETTNEGR
ncbi:MAG: hypothetical protein HC933_18920, partial [Pleurocapsa sp. SU_196_0]|nr:hypothetical protein [Pleurocapsa sp. SU_196_0]